MGSKNKKRYTYLKQLCETEKDIELINETAAVRQKIMRGDTIEIDASAPPVPLHINGIIFFLRKDIAPSSIDTLVEIFENNSHMREPEFSGRRDRVIVDLGANEGFYSLAMLQRNPALRILAVEPNLEIYNILCKNIDANKNIAEDHGCIIPIHTAVTDKQGDTTLQRYPHLSTMSARNIRIMGQSWIDESRIEHETVPSTTLPRLFAEHAINHVDILKIDVEGDETAVLQGVEKSTTEPQAEYEKIKKIVIECHSNKLEEKCISLLVSRGYKLLSRETHKFGDIFLKRESSSQCQKD